MIKTKYNISDKVFILKDHRITEGEIESISLNKIQTLYTISYFDGGESLNDTLPEGIVFSSPQKLSNYLIDEYNKRVNRND